VLQVIEDLLDHHRIFDSDDGGSSDSLVWLALPRFTGVTKARCLLLGAKTPYKRVRLTRGFGTKAAKRTEVARDKGISEQTLYIITIEQGLPVPGSGKQRHQTQREVKEDKKRIKALEQEFKRNDQLDTQEYWNTINLDTHPNTINLDTHPNRPF
jgi:hypothetical protein